MRTIRLSPLVVLLVLSLLAVAVYAAGQCGGQSAGCGSARPQGHCGMAAGQGCGAAAGQCGGRAGMRPAFTRALTEGAVTLAPGAQGPTFTVTDRSHQPDPDASLSAYAMGPRGDRGLTLKRIGPGAFVLADRPMGARELVVRVSRPGRTETVYFGLGMRRAGGCQGPGKCATACKCGADCKCASGDRSNCKCGDACKCGKAAASCKCGAACKCGQGPACKCGTACRCGDGCKCATGDRSNCKCGAACKCGKPAAAAKPAGCGGGCGGK